MVPSHDQKSGFTKPPFLIEHATVIFRINCCDARLAGAPTCVVKPQTVQGHITSLLSKLHRLPAAARIKFNSLMLTYRRQAGAAPSYLNKTLQTHANPQLLHGRLPKSISRLHMTDKRPDADTTRGKAKGTHHEGEDGSNDVSCIWQSKKWCIQILRVHFSFFFFKSKLFTSLLQRFLMMQERVKCPGKCYN